MSNETNLNAAQDNHIFTGKGGKMYKRISFVLAAALVVNLFGMVAPVRAIGVPDVVGMTEDDAKSAITSVGGLFVGDISYEYSDTVPEGHVISQDPAGGTGFWPPQRVDLVISRGPQPVEVPDVVGMTEAEAKSALYSHHLFTWTDRMYSNTVPEGHVISQNPTGGTLVPRGSSVFMWISKGPRSPVEVPDLVGMTEDEAKSAIINAGLYIGTISYEYSNTVPRGHVISQDPAGGTSVVGYSAVDLTVSLGPRPPEIFSLSGFGDAVEVGVPVEFQVTGRNFHSDITVSISDPGASISDVSVGFPMGISVVIGDVVFSCAASNSSQTLTVTNPDGQSDSESFTVGTLHVEVPGVVGMAKAYAESEITAAGLVVGTITDQCSDTVEEGRIISQQPAAETSVACGSSVDLTISLGPCPVEVPDVVGMARAAAESAITAAGLSVGTIGHTNSDAVPEGHVISQNPSGGTSVAEGSEVNLTISLGPPGPEPVEVPDVVGWAETEAGSEINSAGFDVWYSYEHSDTVEEGRVISQDPSGGTLADEGSDVNLTISMGPPGPEEVEVPDVVGMAESDAKSVITSASLNVGAISNDYSDSVPKGFVISQSPASGTSVSEGYSVLLTISLGPEPGDVPSVGEPVAHWKLDEGSGTTVFDASSNGHDGTIQGTTTWIDSQRGYGKALYFAGANPADGYVDCGTWNPSEGTEQLTVALWVRWDGPVEGVWQGVIGKRDGWAVDNMMWQIEINKDNQQISFARIDVYPWCGGIVLPEGEWQHVAVTFDGTTAVFYVNGEETGRGDFSFGAKTDATIAFGCVGGSGWNGFNGALDDIRLYNCALSADNILQLFYAEPIECLVAHWKLDETSGITAGDSSGNGNHGILYGDPTWQPTGGIIDGTLEFDGDGDYVEIPKIGDSVEFTYAMWVAQNQVGSGMRALINHKDWVYGSVHFELRDGHPKVGVNEAITPAGDLDAWGHTLAAGEWYHVALAKSATELLMYVDGEEAARRELITSDTVILGDGFIGAWVNPAWEQTRYFDGWVDDVRIYDCALDENQIKSLISAPPPPEPLSDPLSEALDTALRFTTGGSADWFGQTKTSCYDGDAAQSGDISDEQESWMQTTVSGKGTVKFYWKVSSEEEYDFLEFYIDGELQEKISGLEDYWVHKTYTISTSGSHVLEWRYMKDGATSYGSDCGWVDKVEWVTTP